ncbi:helix-turn-helix domain-containing protein [Nocardiopsis mangrovi]|uniref:Helix-turn-helix domain-containing protein n=1 Tax=Nocardiopsis mangrovi TaxID=1179818 RepID=A0ABV9E4N2_9ACTN
MGDNDLGAFLRARREAVAPADVGLPGGPRRRTPGLRRAELAMVAGISVEYLTRLEQGRDRRPSPEIIGALADALGLAAEERVHLYRLTKVGGGFTCQAAAPPDRTVRPTVRALLDRLEPAPALVANALGELTAFTAGFERLAGPLGLLDGRPPSLTRFVFTDDRARAAFPDWDRIADERAADLRAAASLGDTRAATLADELSVVAGPRFSARYASPAALPGRTGVERWSHPRVGEVALAYETLDLSGPAEQRLTVYLPADGAAESALDLLAAERVG